MFHASSLSSEQKSGRTNSDSSLNVLHSSSKYQSQVLTELTIVLPVWSTTALTIVLPVWSTGALTNVHSDWTSIASPGCGSIM